MLVNVNSLVMLQSSLLPPPPPPILLPSSLTRSLSNGQWGWWNKSQWPHAKNLPGNSDRQHTERKAANKYGRYTNEACHSKAGAHSPSVTDSQSEIQTDIQYRQTDRQWVSQSVSRPPNQSLSEYLVVVTALPSVWGLNRERVRGNKVREGVNTE